jgi:hypothetical protein
MAIFLYADCVVAAGAVWCAGCVVTAVKRFTDACYRGEKGIARGVVCLEDEESVQKRKGVITSPVEVKLRRS